MATNRTNNEEKTVASAVDNDAYYNEKVRIRLPRLRENAEDLFVGVNGKSFLIKRGVDVDVPRYVAECIEESEAAQELSDSYMAKVTK